MTGRSLTSLLQSVGTHCARVLVVKYREHTAVGMTRAGGFAVVTGLVEEGWAHGEGSSGNREPDGGAVVLTTDVQQHGLAWPLHGIAIRRHVSAAINSFERALSFKASMILTCSKQGVTSL